MVKEEDNTREFSCSEGPLQEARARPKHAVAIINSMTGKHWDLMNWAAELREMGELMENYNGEDDGQVLESLGRRLKREGAELASMALALLGEAEKFGMWREACHD